MGKAGFHGNSRQEHERPNKTLNLKKKKKLEKVLISPWYN